MYGEISDSSLSPSQVRDNSENDFHKSTGVGESTLTLKPMDSYPKTKAEAPQNADESQMKLILSEIRSDEKVLLSSLFIMYLMLCSH